MSQKTVMEIPANPLLGDLRKRKKKLRVAAYCRVSTEEEEQQNSFEVQVNYYTEKITHHDGWQLAGIFADDGISGVSTKKRDQFNEMIELCRKKKIESLNLKMSYPNSDLFFYAMNLIILVFCFHGRVSFCQRFPKLSLVEHQGAPFSCSPMVLCWRSR